MSVDRDSRIANLRNYIFLLIWQEKNLEDVLVSDSISSESQEKMRNQLVTLLLAINLAAIEMIEIAANL